MLPQEVRVGTPEFACVAMANRAAVRENLGRRSAGIEVSLSVARHTKQDGCSDYHPRRQVTESRHESPLAVLPDQPARRALFALLRRIEPDQTALHHCRAKRYSLYYIQFTAFEL
jgi:hypothetical protein